MIVVAESFPLSRCDELSTGEIPAPATVLGSCRPKFLTR